jgi:hypothetical protein
VGRPCVLNFGTKFEYLKSNRSRFAVFLQKVTLHFVPVLLLVLGFFYVDYDYEYENRPVKTGLRTTSSLEAVNNK